MAVGLLLLPVGFMVAWFIVPLLQFFGNAFASPRGTVQPFLTLLGTGVYRHIFWNTVMLSIAVTAATVVIAYPVAYALTRASGSRFQVILYCVLFPLWVSVLVRTFSWILLLETNGPINRLLLSAGVIDAPLKLLFNNTGVFIGMVHVLTPYAILPIYTSMRTIDDRLLQASDGMGASVVTTFRRIYLPLTMPGVAGGAAFVFLLSLGFFITPALLGGVNAISIAMLIEQFVNEQLDWVSAAAASIILLVAALALLAVSARFIRLAVMGAR
jgi:putative spermidine/putrescine transport system permease protein